MRAPLLGHRREDGAQGGLRAGRAPAGSPSRAGRRSGASCPLKVISRRGTKGRSFGVRTSEAPPSGSTSSARLSRSPGERYPGPVKGLVVSSHNQSAVDGPSRTTLIMWSNCWGPGTSSRRSGRLLSTRTGLTSRPTLEASAPRSASLVLAVAEQVFQHVCGGTRLHPAQAEADVQVADALRDERVEGRDLGGGRRRAGDQARGLTSDRIARLQPRLRKRPPPAGHVGPGPEVGEHHVGLDPRFAILLRRLPGGGSTFSRKRRTRRSGSGRDLLPGRAQSLAQAHPDVAAARQVQHVGLHGPARHGGQLDVAEGTSGRERLRRITIR